MPACGRGSIPQHPMPYRQPMRRDQIALQLYTVRRLLATDLPGTLAAVAEVGYRSVELAGLPDTAARRARPPPRRRRACRRSPRTRAWTGCGPTRTPSRSGCGCWAARGSSCPRCPRRTAGRSSRVRRFAAELGRLAETLSDHGLHLGYHNHDFEFAPIDGTTAFDVLLSELPAEIEIEVDVYWVSIGGGDPVAAIRAARDRVRMLHMKDRAPDATSRDVPAGSGVLDFPGIVDAGRAARVHWYIAELDDPGDEIADISAAAVYLESLAG